MDICKTISEAITRALESEELRLKPRSEKKPELWPWTVRGGYNEDWTRYLLVRELSGQLPDQELEIEADVGGVALVDLLICGHATVELKGPHKVKEGFDKGIREKILKDFKKQHSRATNKTATEEPNLEHFVLLILHAPKSAFYSGFVQRWLDQLELEVQERNPGICIQLQPSKPLVLNGDKPWLMECCLYRVC